jgi:hypothetical protein
MGMPIKDAVIKFCDTPRTRKEIAAFLGESLQNVIRNYIKPLVTAGRLFYTIPQIPATPKQGFVNAEGKAYIKTDEAVIEFCTLPKSSGAIGRFVGVDKLSALDNIITPLLESGQISRSAAEGSSQQSYVASGASVKTDTPFMAGIKEDFAERYAGRQFTADEVAANFGVTMACAYRRIQRLSKVGWITVRRNGKGYAYEINETPENGDGAGTTPQSVLLDIAEHYKDREFTRADIVADLGILPAAAHARLKRAVRAGILTGAKGAGTAKVIYSVVYRYNTRTRPRGK